MTKDTIGDGRTAQAGTENRRMSCRRLQAFVLRLVGAVEVLAFGAVVMPHLDLRSRWIHPWLAVGVGASVARHESPVPDIVNRTPTTEDGALTPLFRLGAGLGVSPLRWLEVGLSVDVSLTLSEQVGGVERNAAGMLVPGTATIFAPGWGSLSLYASYNFY